MGGLISLFLFDHDVVPGDGESFYLCSYIRVASWHRSNYYSGSSCKRRAFEFYQGFVGVLIHKSGENFVKQGVIYED